MDRHISLTTEFLALCEQAQTEDLTRVQSSSAHTALLTGSAYRNNAVGDTLNTSTSVGAEFGLFCCGKKFRSSILGTDSTSNRCPAGIASSDETLAGSLWP
jgi:hypothetical protein